MSVLTRKRTRESFENKIKLRSQSTQNTYHDSFSNFEKFCNESFTKNMEDVVSDLVVLCKDDEDAIYDVIQDWINWNSGKSYNSLRTWFSCLKNYLHYRGIRMHTIDIKMNLTFPKKIEEELYPLQLDDIQKILDVAGFRQKLTFLAQLSSGMRMGELLQIRKKDLDFTKSRIMIKIPANAAKFNRSRTTFFSNEVKSLIGSRIRNLEDDDPVFGKKDVSVLTQRDGIEAALIRYCAKVGLDGRYESTGKHKITTHSFRAYFITKLSRHDANFAKKLAGQKGYLLQYDRLTDDEKLARYLELEEDLLILDQSRKDAEIEKLQKENESVKKRERRVAVLEEQLRIVFDYMNDGKVKKVNNTKSNQDSQKLYELVK